ncbi:MAG: ATP-binding protein [Verrucomicrobiales bacterium]|jgi:hypothetical protein|nr:ATP-binding protein [Verrucomicrobiales bacterium]
MNNETTISLAKIQRGRVTLPHFLLIYGVDGVGKTTFGAQAPAPIFISAENGFGDLTVDRFPTPKTFAEVLAAVTLLGKERDQHQYQTLVIDSLDWLEPLAHRHACEKYGWKNIEEPGYGKGYVAANEAWLELVNLLKRLRHHLNVVLIAHAAIRPFTDPERNAVYDRYQLKLSGQGGKTDASALWREAVDTVLFANFAVTVTTAKNERKAKAFGTGERVMFTERRPAFDAKNRFNLPFELPLSWAEYEKLCAAPARADEAVARVRELIKGREDWALSWLRVNHWLKDGEDVDQLTEARRERILKNPEGFLETINPNNNEETK